MAFVPAADIDEVIARLEALVAGFRSSGSRLGYFPALYLKVTRAVREGIHAGRFSDGPRMARFDTVFANRYLAALAAWQAGEPCSETWRVAFEAAGRWRPTILQHLLLGMVAHIQLDLGVAAVEADSGQPLAELKGDFLAINQILGELTGPVQDGLDRMSPWMGVLDLAAGNLDEALARFGMDAVRDGAWGFAERLATLEGEARQAAIRSADEAVAANARLLARPLPVMALLCLLVRIPETGDPRKVIEALA